MHNPPPASPVIQRKRVYLPARPGDGTRILVERLWPRGISKASANIHLWLRDIAPSSELRRWFGHDPTRWKAFQRRYHAELEANPEPVTKLVELAEQGDLTLVYAARDEPGTSAEVLQAYLRVRLRNK